MAKQTQEQSFAQRLDECRNCEYRKRYTARRRGLIPVDALVETESIIAPRQCVENFGALCGLASMAVNTYASLHGPEGIKSLTDSGLGELITEVLEERESADAA
jgi:hypothetical protein